MIPRICEPALMEDESQVKAWNNAHRKFSIGGFVEWFKHRKDTSGTIVDVGCGTGALGIEMLSVFPKIKIKGFDGSALMIEYAKENIKNNNLEHVYEVECSMIEDIAPIEDCKTIISLGVLHHFEDPVIFWNSLKRISSMPGTCWMILDIVRPENESEVDEILATIKNKSFEYENDLRNSLYAAFTVDEVKTQLTELNLTYDIDAHVNPIAGELMMVQVRF